MLDEGKSRIRELILGWVSEVVRGRHVVLKRRFQGPQTMFLAFQTEPKLSKIEVQERSSIKRAPGRFKRLSRTPFCQNPLSPFGSRFGFKTRPKNKVCSQRSFGQHLAPNNIRNEAKMASKRDPKTTHGKYGKLCSRPGESSL